MPQDNINYPIALTKPADIRHAVDTSIKSLGGTVATEMYVNKKLVVAVYGDVIEGSFHQSILLYYIKTDAERSDTKTRMILIIPKEADVTPEKIRSIEDTFAA